MMKITDQQRMQLVIDSINGLSIGDALGRHIFRLSLPLTEIVSTKSIPPKPWLYSDDTEMAMAIAEVLAEFHNIDQDALAIKFAQRFIDQPDRGYGAVAYWILSEISKGKDWRSVANSVYDGQGSKGNGAAMRAAPIGAYFYHDLDNVVSQTVKSAQITHAHADGQAGAIAVAIAAALACREAKNFQNSNEFLTEILSYTPKSETYDRIKYSLTLDNVSPQQAAKELSTGIQILSSDTVPLALWCAAANLSSYQNAMWSIISALEGPDSDSDTLCAIVGSIVSLSAGRASIPSAWLASRERLDLDYLLTYKAEQ